MTETDARTIEEAVARAIEFLCRPLVLVVVEDAGRRERMAGWVEAAGYRAVPIGSGQACLGAVSHRHPAAVVLDLDLRGLSGPAILDLLRTAEPGLPVVALAAERGRAADLLLHGADELLVEPVGRAPLARALAAALRSAPVDVLASS